MSPTSYQAAPPRNKLKREGFCHRGGGSSKKKRCLVVGRRRANVGEMVRIGLVLALLVVVGSFSGCLSFDSFHGAADGGVDAAAVPDAGPDASVGDGGRDGGG